MTISKRLVHAFQKEYERKFNQSMSAKEAEQNLTDLSNLIKLILKERKNHHDK